MVEPSMSRAADDPALNAPDVPVEDLARELAGDRRAEDQAAFVGEGDLDENGGLTDTAIYEGDLEAFGGGAEVEHLESLTERELREGETDDPNIAAEEGLTYVPPTDPPVVPADVPEGAEVAAGMGSTALDEPYDADHHAELLSSDDEVTARVREALRADAATSPYADRIAIDTEGGVVTLRGTVEDIDDTDELAAVAAAVSGVSEVRDEFRVRGV
ncbi:MAG TPA: BON domain-containing protein [Candidatus Limnocylindrales bacterium]